MITRTERIADLRRLAEKLDMDGVEQAYRVGEAAGMLEADGKYDQQAMELCEVCGWKAKMDGEPCLVCQLPKIDKLRAAARLALDALYRVEAVERGMVTTKAHHYAARQETTEAIAALKEVLK